jgi:hypothetical protein
VDIAVKRVGQTAAHKNGAQIKGSTSLILRFKLVMDNRELHNSHLQQTKYLVHQQQIVGTSGICITHAA